MLRSQQLTETSVLVSPDSATSKSAADEWGSEANDWDGPEDSSDCITDCDLVPALSAADSKATTNEIECKLFEISLNDTTKCSNFDSTMPECRAVCSSDVDDFKLDTALESCYLYVIDEPSSEEHLQHEEQLLKKYAQREGLDLSSLHTGLKNSSFSHC